MGYISERNQIVSGLEYLITFVKNKANVVYIIVCAFSLKNMQLTFHENSALVKF